MISWSRGTIFPNVTYTHINGWVFCHEHNGFFEAFPEMIDG